MLENLKIILRDNIMSVYIYGSCCLGDFKLGWSDIDILVLTKTSLDNESAEKLLHLRQTLLAENIQYFRSFEGAILPINAFLNGSEDIVVYWGTKGEKIKQNYCLDSFAKKQLIDNANLVYGKDGREQFKMPSYQNLYDDIYRHYLTIREHVQITGRNLYSFGWFLDISRCIYTLKIGEIISKTKAGKFALKNKLCPDEKALKMVLKVRKKPLKYKTNSLIMDYAETLGNSVQKYADILELYLIEYKKECNY